MNIVEVKYNTSSEYTQSKEQEEKRNGLDSSIFQSEAINKRTSAYETDYPSYSDTYVLYDSDVGTDSSCR